MALGEHSSEGRPWLTYILASVPGWTFAAIVALTLYEVTALPGWAAVVVIGALIGADLARFPQVRHYYTSTPSERRILGAPGVAATHLTPRGFVQVRGELWQGRTADPAVSIRQGEALTVREIHGLELVVESMAPHEQQPATRGG